MTIGTKQPGLLGEGSNSLPEWGGPGRGWRAREGLGKGIFISSSHCLCVILALKISPDSSWPDPGLKKLHFGEPFPGSGVFRSY